MVRVSGPLPICYLNGAYLPLTEARVSPLDRAFLFGDAVYEVVPVYGSRPFRLRAHLDRLNRSLREIRMSSALADMEWAQVCQKLIDRNAAGDAYLYLQVTRGAEFGRNHAWPDNLEPTVFGYCSSLETLPATLLESGVSAVTAEDIRWARRDIKSTALLGNILLKKLAADAGAYETIMLEHGELTEGSSTTVHVIEDGVILTPPNGRRILPGTTREVVAELAERTNIRSETTPISEARLRNADEIWLAFATRGVLPVTTLDRKSVGNGRPGALFRQMHTAFHDHIGELAGTPAL
jgi:D-alanine transaminase